MENSNNSKKEIFTPHNPDLQPISLDLPTPSDLPDQIDVSHLSKEITHSGAMESILDQNDDLMARLSVTLRRTSSLEKLVAQYKASETKITVLYENLKDQVLVLRAKARCVQERQDGYDEKHNKVKSELKFFQIKYEEEFKDFEIRLAQSYKDGETLVEEEKKRSTAIEEELSLNINQRETLIAEITERQSIYSIAKQNEVNQLKQSLSRLQKYRTKISLIAHNEREKISALQCSLDSHIENSHSTETTLKSEFEQKIESLEFERSNQIKKIEESTQYIQVQAKNHKREQEDLVNNYETTLSKLKKTLSELTDKTVNHERVFNHNIELKNKLIVIERSQDEQREIHNQEVIKIQEKLAEYRSTAKRVTLESEKLRNENTSYKKDADSRKESHSKLQDQVESLQILWKNTQNDLEVQTTRNSSLQKLNQQLSVSLNDYRKQVKELKSELESRDFSTSNRIDELKKQIQASVTVQKQDFVEASPSEETEADSFRPELMSKIDELLIEIQSGFK